MNNIELLGLGLCTVDYIGIVSHIPINGRVEIKNLEKRCGGASPTAIVVASKLGVSSGFIGKIGDDDLGMLIINDFIKYGVNTSTIITEKESTSGIAFVWIEENSGNRSIAWNSGSKKALKSQDLNSDIIKNAKIIHLDGREGHAALEAIKIIKKNGGKVSLDGGVITPEIQQIVRYTDFLIVSEEFAKKFTGLNKKEKFLKKLKENNAIVTIVTCGKNGFYGYISGQYIEKKAFPVKVVDTNGAGDVFHGAFLFAYLNNMNLEDSLIFANVAASLKCAKFGVRTAVASYHEILDIKNKFKNDL